jgi:ATP-binding cassette subfamily F protein 3
VLQAEAEVSRLTQEIKRLDGALADGSLFARDPAQAAAIAKARAKSAAALAQAEDEWLAAGAALQTAMN